MAFEQGIDGGHGEPRELALFAGAGGGILGGKLLGWRTVCAVEIEDYCRQVLAQRQNDGILHPFPVWDDVRTFDGSPWAGRVDIITGGFPCQDISAAGEGAGIDGKRSGLWREMARIIREVGPRHVLVENSPILTSRGLGTVLGDLAAIGYNAEWGVLGAHHAGAPHKRDRIWILAHYHRAGFKKLNPATQPDPSRLDCRPAAALADTDVQRFQKPNPGELEQPRKAGPERPSENMANATNDRKTTKPNGRQSIAPVSDTNGMHAQGIFSQIPNQKERQISGERSIRSLRDGFAWWNFEPKMDRVAYGVAARVDRLKAIGNGQVPAVAALAWCVLNQQFATTGNSHT